MIDRLLVNPLKDILAFILQISPCCLLGDCVVHDFDEFSQFLGVADEVFFDVGNIVEDGLFPEVFVVEHGLPELGLLDVLVRKDLVHPVH